MGVIDTKIFKSGNSLAVRLPKELGFTVDMSVELEPQESGVMIRRKFDPIKEKQKVLDLVEALRALGPPIVPVEIRDPDIFPDRPGLYQ